MEVLEETGGPFGVDLNDNEEGGGAGERTALKAAMLAGVSGRPEAGKGHVHGTGRMVNRDAPVPHPADIILDLLPDQMAGRCVVSEGCCDHSGLNGFTESLGQEEPAEVGPGRGGGGGGRGCNAAASCPAAPPDRVPTGQQMHPAGKREGGTPDYDDRESPNDVTVTRSSEMPPPFDRPPTPLMGPRLGLDHEEIKVANGGLHVFRAACDPTEPGFLPESADPHPGEGQENDCSRPSVLQGPADPPHFPIPSPPVPSRDSPSKGSSPNLPAPSAPSSPLSGAPIREEDARLPARPQTLRTIPNVAVSLSCDATPLSPDQDGSFYFGLGGYEDDLRSALEAGRRQSAPEKLPEHQERTDGSDAKMIPKRFGIADFFTRSLFSRKAKEPKALSQNATGWRLFGRPPAIEGDPACPLSTHQDEEQKDPGASSTPQRPLVAGRRKNLEFEPLSTTALILEDRPANLPAKSQEETLRHKLEYEEMVAGAKRRELREAQRKKRQMKERHQQEDCISNAMVVWNAEILPHWDSMKGTRRVRELWWQGLPPSVRGRVWSLAIGNELNITPELYEIFLSRAKEKWRSYSETSSVTDSESEGASLADRESSLDLIKLDISRTFPSLFIFQKGGPYHDLLHSVLGAYTCYRPDIGYVQGMSFIAAVLILNLEEAEAFIAFANLLNKPCHMAFFRVDHDLMLKYFAAFEVFFEENLPRLFRHFQTNSLTPDLYLIDWIFTLYSKSLPLDVACRVWDVFCRDGEESLFRTGLGILRLFQDVLLQMDFIHIAQFLTRLPEDLQSHTLFTAMANTHMISRNRRWAQVFSALMKDGNKESDKNASPALRS